MKELACLPCELFRTRGKCGGSSLVSPDAWPTWCWRFSLCSFFCQLLQPQLTAFGCSVQSGEPCVGPTLRPSLRPLAAWPCTVSLPRIPLVTCLGTLFRRQRGSCDTLILHCGRHCLDRAVVFSGVGENLQGCTVPITPLCICC